MREAETGGSRMDRNDSKQEDVRVCMGTSKTKGGITVHQSYVTVWKRRMLLVGIADSPEDTTGA